MTLAGLIAVCRARAPAERTDPGGRPGIGFALVAMLVISSTALDIMRLVALGGG